MNTVNILSLYLLTLMFIGWLSWNFADWQHKRKTGKTVAEEMEEDNINWKEKMDKNMDDLDKLGKDLERLRALPTINPECAEQVEGVLASCEGDSQTLKTMHASIICLAREISELKAINQ